MVIRRCIELLLIVSSVGCVSFQDCEYKFAQNWRAHRAYWECSEDYFGTRMGFHFARGWKKGYSDVLMGGDGQCPAVPPQCYWSHKFQSEWGEAAIEDWYQGYAQGAATALASGREHYNEVPRSDYFRQCSPSCLSSDYAEYDYGKSVLGLQDRITVETKRVPRGRPATEELIPESPKPVTTDENAAVIETEGEEVGSEEIGGDALPPLTSQVEEEAVEEPIAEVMESEEAETFETPITRTGTSFITFNPEDDEEEADSAESEESPRTLEEVEETVEPAQEFDLPPSPVSSREANRSRSLLVSSRWIKSTSYVGRTVKTTRLKLFRAAK